MTFFATAADAAADLRVTDTTSTDGGVGVTATGGALAGGTLVAGSEPGGRALTAGRGLPNLSRFIGGAEAVAITVVGLLITAFGATTITPDAFPFVFCRFFTSSNSPIKYINQQQGIIVSKGCYVRI